MRTLADNHRRELVEGSGIFPAVVEARGYWTATKPEELLALGYSPEQASLVPAMVLPFVGVDGEGVGQQVKPDAPRTNDEGKLVKYETPARWKMRLDVGTGPKDWLRDPATPMWITEGIKKGDAGASRNMKVVTLAGVWNWRGSSETGGSVELADWEAINLKGRVVHLCFDSDVMLKAEVKMALRRLAGFLRRRGARVVCVVPPDDPAHPGKTGMDDFFVRGGKSIDLVKCVDDSLLDSRDIMIAGRSVADITADALAAIVDSNIPPATFLRAGELSRVTFDERGIAKIQAYNVSSMRGLMVRTAQFVRPKTVGKKKEGTVVALGPPREAIEDLLSLGRWPEIPPLVAITHAPVLAPDGSISEAPGYCPASGFYVASRTALPPWRGTLQEAVDLVRDVLYDFPFQGEADFAHALALMLLPIVRPVISGPTPLHLIDAPVQGTGKSLLAEVLLMPTMGDKVSATPGTRDEEEWRKKIAAALLEGRAYLWLDNLSRKVDSDSLAGALTSTEWNDRALSTMNNINVPIRVVWVATTNNAELSRDILRRTVWMRIDAQLEQPGDRTVFRHPEIKDFICANRPRIVSALCAIVRAWVDAGRPAFSGRRLGSFESWAKVMGGILDVAGVPGFLSNTEELRVHADSAELAWADFYRRWRRDYPTQPVKAGNLLSMFKDDDELGALLGDRGSEASEKQRLGHLLKKRVGLVSGGLRIERCELDSHTQKMLYRIAEVAPFTKLSDQNGAKTVQTLAIDLEPVEEVVAPFAPFAPFSKETFHTHTPAHACESADKNGQKGATEEKGCKQQDLRDGEILL